MFHMYDKKFISVMSHALDPPPLSQTHFLGHPSPSSVTYFMDGPLGGRQAASKFRILGRPPVTLLQNDSCIAEMKIV